MIVYNKSMRRKDENKKEAIFKATKELLNEIGFADISMSKIAKRAGVSAATIYVYFENKDDMLKKLYLDVKRNLFRALQAVLDDSQPVRYAVEQAMRSYLAFIMENKADYLFLEQFSNSPMLQNLCIEEELPSFGSLFAIIEKGKREGLLRPVDDYLILHYCYLPISQLAKEQMKGNAQISEESIQTVIDMSWNAIRA